MYIVVAIQPPLAESTAPSNEMSKVQINIVIKDKMTEQELRLMEDDLRVVVREWIDRWDLV